MESFVKKRTPQMHLGNYPFGNFFFDDLTRFVCESFTETPTVKLYIVMAQLNISLLS